MSDPEKIGYKAVLQKKCFTILEERIYSIRIAMHEAQLAANNEEKSSAGDKYETSRAMNHLEKDMQASRLSTALKALENLLLIKCDKIFDFAQQGSFVKCDKAAYFIAAGLGKTLIENQTVFLVSPNAPVALAMAGKKAGDLFEFNEQPFIIKDVY